MGVMPTVALSQEKLWWRKLARGLDYLHKMAATQWSLIPGLQHLKPYHFQTFWKDSLTTRAASLHKIWKSEKARAVMLF
jgi:hypothetical protein